MVLRWYSSTCDIVTAKSKLKIVTNFIYKTQKVKKVIDKMNVLTRIIVIYTPLGLTLQPTTYYFFNFFLTSTSQEDKTHSALTSIPKRNNATSPNENYKSGSTLTVALENWLNHSASYNLAV